MSSILDSFKAAKTAVLQVLSTHNLDIKSAGTKSLILDKRLDDASGYWENPGAIAQKPPRLIVHFKRDGEAMAASLPRDDANNLLVAATTLGIANNREGNAAAFGFRVLGAVQVTENPSSYEFPPAWEWVVILIFPEPLPAGTSGQLISGFDLDAARVSYAGHNPTVAHIAIVPQKIPPATVASTAVGDFSYEDATNALASFLNSGSAVANVYKPDDSSDMTELGAKVEAAIAGYLSGASIAGASMPVLVPEVGEKSVVPEGGSLYGLPQTIFQEINAALSIGKKHFIFYGPPGTGKTTLAEQVAAQLSNSDSEDGSYVLLTASSAWTGQDLIGGYQPLGNGLIGFIPGALLRNFDKPLIIDEMNRCPIDKVIGPLFSVLSGQVSTLPYRLDVSNPNSDFYCILPKAKVAPALCEYAPGDDWHILCTLNTVDRTQLGQISYALSRRFAWIKVGVPNDLDDFVKEILVRDKVIDVKPVSGINPVAQMWIAVNSIREIGGAPIIDFLRIARKIAPDLDFFTPPSLINAQVLARVMAITMLPLLDGIERRDAEILAENIERAWGLPLNSSLRADIMELAL